MIIGTRVFELYSERYRNIAELAEAMSISVSQVYRVCDGKRLINQKFIVGAMRAFPEYHLDELFFLESDNGSSVAEDSRDDDYGQAMPIGSTSISHP